ncbi:MAG: proline--tRNA ligase [Syntrophobacteraceae bacterium CG2_30_61_12]|nr:MAG: proline--tRNA ligase [Syntrophobacteraceae bacterium CG2_30_61_12]
MRYSNSFIHTLFEVPKEAETPSHILLLRGCYIYPTAAGVYSLLPLGHRVAEKIKTILREEMNGIGGIELTMPVLNPAELWKATRRYYDIGSELFRIKDRKDREFVLAMTHEEVITDIARQFLRSYRDLPIMLYQIATKIRDEARPRAGLLRVREFFMKDGYSFHPDFADLDAYYPKIFNAYLRIFTRCGLKVYPIEADSGIMGGTGSHEFMLESTNGEDRFVVCPNCGYQANTEKAVGLKPVPPVDPEPAPPMTKVATPEIKTIAQLMTFFGVAEHRLLKTVAYQADGELVLAVVRGDFNVSATKLTNHLKVVHLDLAAEALLAEKGLYGGFLSPVNLHGVRLVLDTSVDSRNRYIAGANQPDQHYVDVVYGRDFTASEVVDIAEVRAGDTCAACAAGPLEIRRGIELGHTFKLGTKYTAPESMNVTYLDRGGEQRRLIMGCYGIGVERLLAAAVEYSHDDAGIRWPISIAPFQVIISALGQNPEVVATAERIHVALARDYEVLLDDRADSPGVKLKDADLLGIPIRVVVSQRGLKSGRLEVKVRATGLVHQCPEAELPELLAGIVRDLQPSLAGLPYLPETTPPAR